MTFLEENGCQSPSRSCTSAHWPRLRRAPMKAGWSRAFLGEHIVFRASYFHNEFGSEIEDVGLDLVPELLPNLTPAEQQAARSAILLE